MIEQIGVQLFTIRRYTQTLEGLEEAIRKLYAMGYRHFELARIQFSASEMTLLKLLKDELGLIYTTCQIKLPVINQQFDWLIHFAKTLDIESIEVSVIPIMAFLRREIGLIKLANQLNELGKRMKEQGIALLYHHHNFEMISIGNVKGIDILMANTDRRFVNYVIDTYWLARSGVNPGSFIATHDDRIRGIHLRDCQYHYRRFQFVFNDCAIGDGTVDFRFLESVNHKFLSVEQATEQPFEMLRQSREYLINLKLQV